ncbi:MAG: type II CRISPR-associated endonuclease Cas1 [Pseudomonadota bacterium]
MQNRIVEIASDDIHLSLLRGFLKLSRDGQELGRVGLPDIGAVIIRGYGATLSVNVAARLAEENIPVILCGADQTPASVIWPIDGHHAQGRIMEGQSTLSRPKQKRVWQALVQAKIFAQAEVLAVEDKAASDLRHMARKVRSGDPDNFEAQAARKYWPRMMADLDEHFKRDSASVGLNGWLNYGYAVLRAGAARSILSAGLHPSLSVHHESRGEALRLASDIMEPFRPWVDLTVRRLALKQPDDLPQLDRDSKAAIIEVLNLDLETTYGASPVQTCLNRLCQSFARICLGEHNKLDLPDGLVFTPAGGGG